MTSQRITASIRDALIMRAVERKYAKAREELAKRKQEIDALQQKHQQEAYYEVFGKETIKKINAVPDGWLPTTDNVLVSVIYSDGHQDMIRVKFDKPRPVPSKYASRYGNGAVVSVLDEKDCQFLKNRKIIKDLSEEWSNDRRDVVTGEKEIGLKVRAVIESVTTTGRLKEVWPEVSELLPSGSEKAGAMLPAVSLDDLNAELGLGKKV